MTIPLSTLRLQFHKDFPFDAALARLDYFSGLGVSHLYASPITTARPGSLHGYDVVDPTQVSAELGGEDGLRELVAGLRAKGMGLIIDIVPNHMGVGASENPWWADVLAWGERSRYARYFDIDWNTPVPGLKGKVLAPILGSDYAEALAGLIKLVFDAEQGRFQIAYYDNIFPVSAASHADILRNSGNADADAYARPFDVLERLEEPEHLQDQAERAHGGLRQFARSEAGQAAIKAALAAHDGANEATRPALHRLLEQQHYRLSTWRCASDEVNWRRFFDVNTLAGLRIEVPEVFEATHALIFRLYEEGLIDGVRIDHIDGLAWPGQYCRKLRERLESLTEKRPADVPHGRPWIVVEKILAQGERLHTDWGVDGTTGYDFMNEAGALLHDHRHLPELKAAWQAWTDDDIPDDYAVVAESARRKILTEHFSSELDAATRALQNVARRHLVSREVTFHALRRVLIELVVHFPVYRVYTGEHGMSEQDQALLDKAVDGARQTLRRVDVPVLERLAQWLKGWPNVGANSEANPDALAPLDRENDQAARTAIQRILQLTSPVNAKSIEDTAFYRYGVLLSRNEVGADPALFAMSPEAFHAAVKRRQQDFPQAMLTTATHDHKRGEGVRTRLAVLSEMPERWIEVVNEWRALNQTRLAQIDGASVPPADVEIMLYEMLAGAWPAGMPGEESHAQELQAFIERIVAWQEKAQREAKLRTDWFVPDADYEAASRNFVTGSCAPDTPFVKQMYGFVQQIAAVGAINSLSQAALRSTLPGVPDLYQGTEYWDLSLVDPDNRRPVDYAARARSLDAWNAATDKTALLQDLIGHWHDGEVKQALIASLLQFRRDYPAVFVEGDYQPLVIKGSREQHALAFVRQHADQVLIVVVARWPWQLAGALPTPAIHPDAWADTRLDLSGKLNAHDLLLGQLSWRDVITGRDIAGGNELHLGEIMQPLPLAVLHAKVR